MRIWDRLQAWVSRADQRCYYWILTLALLLPNVVLSVVMQQPAVGRVLNILLMLPVYMLLLLSAKRPGRVCWGASGGDISRWIGNSHHKLPAGLFTV